MTDVAARCACVPGARCRPCTERGRAHHRMYRIASGVNRHTRPVEWADEQTSMNDARAALCLAIGVPLVEIHPCTGHDLRRHR